MSWMFTISNPTPETIFCKVTQKMQGPHLKLIYNYLLPYPFQFTIIQLFYTI
jgi:hypothetical protein